MSRESDRDWFNGILKTHRGKPSVGEFSQKHFFDEGKDLPVKDLKKILFLALDVDGVLTDGTINIGSEGELFKGFNAKDGMGVSIAHRSDLKIAIITGRFSEIVYRRAEELGITLIYEGVKDKAKALREIIHGLGLKREQVAFMGDDLNDLAVVNEVGVFFAPSDAVADVRMAADVLTIAEAGKGAVREAIEVILRSQGKWERIVDEYRKGGRGDRQ